MLLPGYYWKKIVSVGEDMEKTEPMYNAGGKVNLYSHYRKQYGNSQNN